MPDLRFEQSYLHSIRNADTWWKVGWITVRDQVRLSWQSKTRNIFSLEGYCSAS
jgi:hypothetical protein